MNVVVECSTYGDLKCSVVSIAQPSRDQYVSAAGWRREARDRRRSSNKEQNGFAVRPRGSLEGTPTILGPRACTFLCTRLGPAIIKKYDDCRLLPFTVVRFCLVLVRRSPGQLYPLTRARCSPTRSGPVPNFKWPSSSSRIELVARART